MPVPPFCERTLITRGAAGPRTTVFGKGMDMGHRSGSGAGAAAGCRWFRALLQRNGFLRSMDLHALRVLLQSYYDLHMCGLKQSSWSWPMIGQDESIRFIESDGNDGVIESDGNDEFNESSGFDESLRLNGFVLCRRRADGEPRSLPAGRNAP